MIRSTLALALAVLALAVLALAVLALMGRGGGAMEPLPHATEPLPHATEPLPHATEPLPHATEPLPHATEPPPHATEPPPHATEPPPPAAGTPCPSGADAVYLLAVGPPLKTLLTLAETARVAVGATAEQLGAVQGAADAILDELAPPGARAVGVAADAAANSALLAVLAVGEAQGGNLLAAASAARHVVEAAASARDALGLIEAYCARVP